MFPDAGDEAYMKAPQLYDLACTLKGILGDDLVAKLQEDSVNELLECHAQLGVCIEGLYTRSKPSNTAISIGKTCRSVSLLPKSAQLRFAE